MTRYDLDPAPADQAAHWVLRLASGAMDADELAAFKTWLAEAPAHGAAFDRERALWQSLERAEAHFRPAPPPRRRWRGGSVARRRAVASMVGALAASLAMVWIAPEAIVRFEADLRAPTGEVRTAMLPDGSKVMLDSGAAIAVHFDRGERRIDLLRGKAWFEVRHGSDRPFRVAALGGMTQDIGTAFEVAQADRHVAVAVTQGAVRVSAKGSATELRQFDRAGYARGGAVERLAPGTPTAIAAWRRGIILIDNRPMAEAIAEIARYRPGATLTLADISASTPVSGVFRIDAPDEALRTLAQMAGLHMTTLPGGIAVLRR